MSFVELGTKPCFSVVIPTCNRHSDLAKCLDLLAPGIQAGMEVVTLIDGSLEPAMFEEAASYEVIVTDDGLDSSGERLVHEFYPWVRWVKGPRKGPASNRNHGAMKACGDWIVFTDDDCLPCHNWLLAYSKEVKSRSEDVYEGRTIATGKRRSLDMDAPINTMGGYLWSCNFAIRRKLFQEMNGFDTGFPGPAMEDVEFHTRLIEMAVPIYFVPDAEVSHPWRKRKGWRFCAVYARSVVYYCARHPQKRRAFTLRTRFWNLIRVLLRTLPGALREFSGRGYLRMALLELVTFVQLTWIQWKSKKIKPR